MSAAQREVRRARRLLLNSVRNPLNTLALPEEDWDLLLRVARRGSLTGRLAAQLEHSGALSRVPARAQAQLKNAMAEVFKLRQMGAWEINRVLWALQGTNIRITLLKGMAYYLADLPTAMGRPFSDVDIMVPESQLEAVAKLLTDHGWISIKLDPYDQFYYREWMHELPPLRHSEREAVVDLHHAITPRTSRLETDSARLLAAAHFLEDERLQVLSPSDMLLHSAVHLFHDGDMTSALRDLVDIDSLLKHFGGESRFWQGLLPRAAELGLTRPLFYAFRYSKRLLETPVPEDILTASKAYSPCWPILWIMDRVVPAALIPLHPDFTSRRIAFAQWLLYVRSHYLRMPLHLLIPHLWRKGIMRQKRSYEN